VWEVFKMVSITLSVPEEMKNDMEQFEIINWSAVAREAIKQKLTMLKKFKEFTKDSTMTEEDALRLGGEVNKAVSKKYNKSS
jgi:hypothetical protein